MFLREPSGHYYLPQFLTHQDRHEITSYLASLHPIWESRYHDRPEDRRLLRPVYWLGGWQFACLDYYHPTKRPRFTCVNAEPFPSSLRRVVQKAEKFVRSKWKPADIPEGWKLNTCLINYYGRILQDGKWVDGARVGEHRDYEPGPVASLSLGERAFFQFVRTQGRHLPSRVVYQTWLDDGSLQIFGGRTCKHDLFHRVQRVERKRGICFSTPVREFECRRINITFRYVPEKDIVRLQDLPSTVTSMVKPYVERLGRHSNFWSLNTRSFKTNPPLHSN